MLRMYVRYVSMLRMFIYVVLCMYARDICMCDLYVCMSCMYVCMHVESYVCTFVYTCYAMLRYDMLCMLCMYVRCVCMYAMYVRVVCRLCTYDSLGM